jgi:glycosyltransferase involved in cell wall biosynthesis
MKVLHVTPTYVPAWRYGGPIRSVHGLCKSLVAQGVAVDVATTTVDGAATLDVPVGVPVDVDGVRVRYFDSPLLRRLYWSPGLARYVSEHLREYDLLHLHSIFLWPTSYAARIARKRGVPYLLSPRGMLVDTLIWRRNRWLKLAWINLLERRNLRAAAMIHFTSEAEASDAEKLGIEWSAHCIVPNGVDLEPEPGEAGSITPAASPFGDRPFVMYLGRLTWKKGLDRLISSMTRIPGANLLIVGNDEEGYAAALEAQAVREGVRERVIFTGPVIGAAKHGLLRRAAVLVLPSYSENFGNVVLEAMAEGCPVVVTPEVGAASIVEQSAAGLVTAGDPAALAAAIARMLADPALRAQMGRRGRETVAAQYSWDAIARQMIGRYEAVLRDGHRERSR